MSPCTSALAMIVSAGIFLSSATVLASGSLPSLTSIAVFADAFTNEESNIQVRQSGEIVSVLADDTVGDRHQRMIIRLTNNQTLLIAHNIDLSPRVPNPQAGKLLGFYGEYEWNDKGGVIHWTHEDPDGNHIAGWLEYEGKRYGSRGSTKTLVPATPTCRMVHRNTVQFTRCQFTILGKTVPNSTLHRGTQVYLKKSAGAKRGVVSF